MSTDVPQGMERGKPPPLESVVSTVHDSCIKADLPSCEVIMCAGGLSCLAPRPPDQ